MASHGPKPAEIQEAVAQVDRLISLGRRLHESSRREVDRPIWQREIARWQESCSAAVGRLSGGDKSHWLARAYREAYLGAAGDPLGAAGCPSDAARPALGAPGHPPDVAPAGSARQAPDVPAGSAAPADVAPAQLVARVLEVLGQARRSLLQLAAGLHSQRNGVGRAPETHPAPKRLEIGADATLRASLERAYAEAIAAEGLGDLALAFVIWCSVLEAAITSALEASGPTALAAHGAPDRPVAEWPFTTRIAVAEAAKLISRGCARLPALGRDYYRLLDERGEVRADAVVAERDVRIARQVTNVILRDLERSR